VPLAVWTSRLDLGRATRRLGLFLTEDEVHPSAVLRAYRAATGAGMRPAIAEAWTAAAPRPAQSPPRGEPLETLS
jgi:membrane glycosyltransferase